MENKALFPLKRFKKIYIEITNNCNLRCSFCPQRLENKRAMKPSEFQKILKQAAPLSEEICLHVSGEPLFHPNFLEIIGICEELKVTSLQVTTNGILLDRYHEELLKTPSIKQINFSLQSFMDNYPDQNFKTYLFKVLDFIREGSLKKPELYFNLRLWNQSLDNDQERNSLVFDLLEQYFEITINRRVDVGGYKSKRIWNKLYLHFDSRFEWPSMEGHFLGRNGRCKGLIDHIGILSNGDVIPCCLDKDGVMNLGNCLIDPLDQILSQDRVLKMRKGFDDGELIEPLCQRCNFVRRFSKTRI